MRSMTGFGQASWQQGGRALTVEIKSVNQRFLEVKLNLPREYLPWEGELRGLVQEGVARGRVDVSVFRGGANAVQYAVEANTPLARAYVDAWHELQQALQLKGDIDLGFLQGRSEFMRVVERRTDPSGEIDAARDTVRRAVAAFNRDRDREGRALAKDMTARTRHLQQLQRQIGRRAARLKPHLVTRLRERVAAALENRDVNDERLLHEVALIIERGDVTEELVRLQSHLDAMTALLRAAGPVGKKIDFLLQEVHREFNTIASKSTDLEITNATLDARGEIEKLREQVQNVE